MNLTKTIRKRVAELYWNSDMSLQEIATLHSITPAAVTLAGKDFSSMNVREKMKIKDFQEQEEASKKDYVVIKVESKWVPGISQLLDSRGIPHEVPQKFELTEYYESKI